MQPGIDLYGSPHGNQKKSNHFTQGHVAYGWSTDHHSCHTSIHTYRPILITLLCHSLRNRFWSGPQGHSSDTTRVQLKSSPAWVCGLSFTLPSSILSESTIN